MRAAACIAGSRHFEESNDAKSVRHRTRSAGVVRARSVLDAFKVNRGKRRKRELLRPASRDCTAANLRSTDE